MTRDGGKVSNALVIGPSPRRPEGWTSGAFFHLKEVCWSDPTNMFQRYKQLVRAPDSTLQEPRVLAPFYAPLEGMWELFTRVTTGGAILSLPSVSRLVSFTPFPYYFLFCISRRAGWEASLYPHTLGVGDMT